MSKDKKRRTRSAFPVGKCSASSPLRCSHPGKQPCRGQPCRRLLEIAGAALRLWELAAMSRMPAVQARRTYRLPRHLQTTSAPLHTFTRRHRLVLDRAAINQENSNSSSTQSNQARQAHSRRIYNEWRSHTLSKLLRRPTPPSIQLTSRDRQSLHQVKKLGHSSKTQ